MNVKLPKIDQSQKKLPSEYQIGDYCHVVVSRAASEADLESILYYGKVIKIHFAPNKLTYDLEFGVSVDVVEKKRYVTRIHNVDAGLCERIDTPIPAGESIIESPFSHGGWHNSDQFPKGDFPEGYSFDVLVDLNGRRKDFSVGWYDFDKKEWTFHVLDTSAVDVKHLSWAYLPLAD